MGEGSAATAPSRRFRIHSTTREFSPKPGHMKAALVVFLEPVHVENSRHSTDSAESVSHVEPVLHVVAHVVSAKGHHGERVAAHFAECALSGSGFF
jgi:hypothetical protein